MKPWREVPPADRAWVLECLRMLRAKFAETSPADRVLYALTPDAARERDNRIAAVEAAITALEVPQ